MTTVERLGAADEIELIAQNADGTPRKPVIIWVVRVHDGLYARSYRGTTSVWYRHAVARPQGQVAGAGVTCEVRFERADESVQSAVDGAYREKYGRYGKSYVVAMTGESARKTTIKIVPT